MKNDSFFNRMPLPLLIVVWLGLVALGAVLVYTVFFNKPADSTAQAPVQKTPIAQVTKPPVKSAPTQAVQQPQATSQPTLNPKFGPDGLYPELDFGYGVQVNGLVGDAKLAADLADRVHARWIKQQLQWGVFEHEQGQIDWTGFDNIINAAHERGLRVMLSIPTAPQWTHANLPPSVRDPVKGGEDDPDAIKGPPDDPQAYANFIGQVIDRYKGKIQAIEVWNEQNLVREWRTNPQTLDAKRYVDLLRATYQVVKAKDSSITVISGAPSPTGVDNGVEVTDDVRYLQQMIDNGLLDTVDCVGAHHNGYNVGPNVSVAEAPTLPKAATANFKGPFDASQGPPHRSWYFKDTLQAYNQMLGGRKPICVTEFGWATSQDYDSFPPGFEFAQDNTVEEQGNNIVAAYQLMKEWGFVKMAFLWNLDYGNKGKGPQDDPVPYSLIKTDGSKRGSWDPVRKYLKEVTGDD